MGRFEKRSFDGNAAKKNRFEKDVKVDKFNDGKIAKAGKKDKKQILRGANAWRDIDDRPKEEIDKETFENRKLYKINEKGDKVKDFQKKGAVRPWLDLKFEENDRMTYYEGFFVKKSDVESLDKLRQDMEFQEVDKYTVKRKMMKAIRKAKRELFKELLYEEKLKQIKEGTYKGPVKVWNKKDKAAGTTADNQESCELLNNDLNRTNSNETNKEQTINKNKDKLPMKGNNNEAKEKQSSTCPDSIEGLDLNYEFGSMSDENENMTTNKVNFAGETEEMEFNGIPYAIMESNVDDLPDSDPESEAKSESEVKENMATTENKVEKNQTEKGESVPAKTTLVFEENMLMTCVEGFWIRRSCLLKVDELRASKKKEIIAAREDGNDSPALHKNEEKKYKIAMKVVLLKMANQLRANLQKRATQKAKKPKADPSKVAAKKPKGERKQRPQKGMSDRRGGQDWSQQQQYGRDNRSNGRDSSGQRPWQNNKDSSKSGLVRFDGYWIKKDAADRLRELKESLKKEGLAADKLAEVMKVERRREENEVKTQRKTVCFSCRKSGHVVADCPLKQNTAGVGSCFKCGSSEHQSSACTSTSTVTNATSEYSYATCFICRQRGHISRECPRNTRGLYPDGGGCTLCDSNQHLIKDCPRNKDEKQGANKEVRATEFRAGQLLEVDDEDNGATHTAAPKRQNKHIKF